VGYLTYYNLDVHEGDVAIHEILSKITEEEFEGLYYSVDEKWRMYRFS
jgi:hypothetical protein